MARPATSGNWAVASYASAAGIEGLMIETQVQGKKVLVPFSELAAAVSRATGDVPLPTEPGTYIMNVTITEDGPTYEWKAADPLEFAEP